MRATGTAIAPEQLVASFEADADLARRCAARDRSAIEQVISSNNRQLFRTAWSILRSRPDAEEAVQSAYLRAFTKIGSFEGRSSLATWLTRIVVNEALGRRRANARRCRHLAEEGVAMLDDYRHALMRGSDAETPDASIARKQVRKMLEQAVEELPDQYRTVFVLRDVEGLSGEEVAEILDIPTATVKTRLFRSRRKMKELLAPEVAAVLSGTFPFAGADCAALTKRVIADLALPLQ
jgi:RNA polymerase sigma-70 factor (ECF subfamily)